MGRETEARTTHAEGLLGRKLLMQVVPVDFINALSWRRQKIPSELYERFIPRHLQHMQLNWELGWKPTAWSLRLTFPASLGLIPPVQRWVTPQWVALSSTPALPTPLQQCRFRGEREATSPWLLQRSSEIAEKDRRWRERDHLKSLGKRGETYVCPLPYISTSKVAEEQGIPKEHAAVGSCGVNESALSNAWSLLPSQIESYTKKKKKKKPASFWKNRWGLGTLSCHLLTSGFQPAVGNIFCTKLDFFWLSE